VIERRELGKSESVDVAHFDYSVRPGARPIEELYERHRIVLVYQGAFECRASGGLETLVPGSTLLANTGSPYEYRHDHRWPERCVSFAYAPAVLEDIVSGVGLSSTSFQRLALPPSARFAAIAQLLVSGHTSASAEEWAYALAAEVLTKQAESKRPQPATTHVERRRALDACRFIEARASEPLSLSTVAAEVGLSPFHFLRSFKRALGSTPHQYLVQTRLRRAAELTMQTSRPITDIALAAGFSDLANFNRSFRSAIGCAPRQLRERADAELRRARTGRAPVRR
jgi:AraC-like DNA-binding protein